MKSPGFSPNRRLPFRPCLVTFEPRITPGVLAAGDFNGDGFGDLAVGQPETNIGAGTAAGLVRVWYGSAAGYAGAGQVWSQDTTGVQDAAESGDRFGFSLAAGDLNGDGRDDLAVGVPYEDLGDAVDGGAVQVLYGSGSGLTAAGNQRWSQGSGGIVHRTATGDQFGYAVTTGDFNGGGYDDLVAGMPGNRAGPNDVPGGGGAVVIYGSASGLTSMGNRSFDATSRASWEKCSGTSTTGWRSPPVISTGTAGTTWPSASRTRTASGPPRWRTPGR